MPFTLTTHRAGQLWRPVSEDIDESNVLTPQSWPFTTIACVRPHRRIVRRGFAAVNLHVTVTNYTARLSLPDLYHVIFISLNSLMVGWKRTRSGVWLDIPSNLAQHSFFLPGACCYLYTSCQYSATTDIESMQVDSRNPSHSLAVWQTSHYIIRQCNSVVSNDSIHICHYITIEHASLMSMVIIYTQEPDVN